jgi:hypothetical protein
MFKLHVMVSEIVMRLHEGEVHVASALTVQLHKVLFQLGLENGEWSTATLL